MCSLSSVAHPEHFEDLGRGNEFWKASLSIAEWLGRGSLLPSICLVSREGVPVGRLPGFQLGKSQLFWGKYIFWYANLFFKKLSKQKPPPLSHPCLPLLSMCETPRYDMIVI